jgi:hypothetical protein
LLNHLTSIWGAEVHIEFMGWLRLFYRNILAETLLLGAVFTQIVSGIKLFKLSKKNAVSFFEKLQIWTGFYLAIFLVIHLSAILVGRFWLKLDTNFYFGVAGLNNFPFNLFFVPYYGLAMLAFFGHLAAIHARKMKRAIFGLPPKRQAIGFLIFGFVFSSLVFYGLTNRFNGVVLPAKYEVLIGK